MEEAIPFLPGPIPKQLGQQRADKATAIFLRQLMASEDFHEVLARKKTCTSCAWKTAMNVLGILGATLLVFATLYSYNNLGNQVTSADQGASDYVDKTPDYSESRTTQPVHVSVSLQPSSPPEAVEPSQLLHPSQDSPTDIEQRTSAISPLSADVTAWQPPQKVNIAQPVDLTPASVCALDLVYTCNELAPVPQRPSAVKQGSASECDALVGTTQEPAQKLPPSIPTSGVTGMLSMLSCAITACATVMMIFVTATLLVKVATYLGFAFVLTDNVGTAAYIEPEHNYRQVTAPEGTAEPPSRFVQAKGQHEDAVNLSTAAEISAYVQPESASQDAVNSMHNDACTHNNAPLAAATLPASPLLDAQLISTPSSQVTLPGVDATLDCLRSSTPLAMAALTPTEPPSPFPGFPALSSFASQRPHDEATHAEELVGFSQEQLCNEGNMPDAEPAKPAPQCPGDSHADSWGSSTGGQVPSAASSSVSSEPRVEPTSPGMGPWPLVYPLSSETPDSASASSANRGIQQVSSMEAASAIFDLSHFDEDGEEVASMAPLQFVRAEEGGGNGASVTQARHKPKWRFPLRKAPVSRESDIRTSDVLSTAEPDAVTPTWPPKSAAGLAAGASLDLGDADEDLISYEALSLSRTLHSHAAGESHFAASGADDGGSLRPGQEPGREYAAVTAAASVLLCNFKSSAKSVLLAACAGDEIALRTAQSEVHAAVAQVLNMDLAAHAYTTAVGACKALGYSTAATPASTGHPGIGSAGLSSDARTTDSGSSGGAKSWASIGSRVISGGEGAPMPTPIREVAIDGPYATGSSVFLPASRALSPSAPAVSSGSDEGPATGTEAWLDGPVPLPEDIDAYLATRCKGEAPSAHLLAGLQDSLAYAGLLANAAGSQIAMFRTELLETAAAHRSAQEAASVWRQRALAAEARLAAMGVEVLGAAVEGIDDLRMTVDSSGGGNAWVCVELPSSSASDDSESVSDAVLGNEQSASATVQKPGLPPTDELSILSQPQAALPRGMLAGSQDEPVCNVAATVSDVVHDLVGLVVRSLEAQSDEAEMGFEPTPASVAAGSSDDAFRSDATIVARTGFYGWSSPASLRSGSGSCCAAADRTPEQAHTATDGEYPDSGMGSRIGPLEDSPTVGSLATRLDEAFSGAEQSPDTGARRSGSGRFLWRPPQL